MNPFFGGIRGLVFALHRDDYNNMVLNVKYISILFACNFSFKLFLRTNICLINQSSSLVELIPLWNIQNPIHIQIYDYWHLNDMELRKGNFNCIIVGLL